MRRSLLKWGIVLLLLTTAAGYLLGPSRLYGFLFSEELVATVADIRAFTPAADKASETFAIEFHDDSGQIYVATSTERVWGVIAKGDRVKTRLYPAASWSQSDGSWINAKLLCKLARPK